MKTKYVYNSHIAPITANARSEDGKVIWTKRFLPMQKDSMIGRVISTGYTAITEDEHDLLVKTSKVFKKYVENKLLRVQDDIPPDAKTPHEALVGERKRVAELTTKLEVERAEKAKLQAELEEYKTKYGQLVSAGEGGKKRKGDDN